MADSDKEADQAQDVQRATEELQRVHEAITALTGLPSNWNGTVELHITPDWRGAKPFRCVILLDAALMDQDERWRTLIHETLHACSRGYLRAAFEDFPGWEEGIVEKLQRLLRPQVLARLGLAIPEAIFAEGDASHQFNPYIVALESLYVLARKPDESEIDFYVALLSTPINQRMVWMMARGKLLSEDKRHDFMRVFSSSGAILRRKLKP